MKMYNYDYIIVESENHFAKYLLKKDLKMLSYICIMIN